MYNPGTPCIPQVLRRWGFSCTITFIPGGASGVLLNSKCPSSAVYADIIGFFQQDLIIFSSIVACGVSQNHRCIGKWVSTLERPSMKWYFHFLMPRSAALTRWMCGGTNWYSISFCLLYFLRLSDDSLPNQWTRGLYTLWVIYFNYFV